MRLVYDHAARRAYTRDGKPIEDKKLEREVLRQGPRFASGPARFFRFVVPRPVDVAAFNVPHAPSCFEQSVYEVEIVNRRVGFAERWFKPRSWVEAERQAVQAMLDYCERDARAALIQMQQTKPAPKAEPSVRFCHADQYIEKLEKRGYRVLGAGSYSTVLAKPGSKRVIKVGRNLDAWPDYVLWANRAGFAGTWAPRIYSFRRHKCHMSEFYVAVMERMDKTVAALDMKVSQPAYRVQSALASFLYGAQRSAANVTAAAYLDEALEADKLMPGALRFALSLIKWRNSIDAGFDLHTHNWMLAGDRLVCTDPVVEPRGGKQSTAPRRVTSRDLQHAA